MNGFPLPGSPPPSHTHVKLTSHVPKLESSGTDGGCHLSQGSWKLTSLPTEAQREKKEKNLKMWCRTEKWWFENGWAQEKARRGARYGGLHVRRKPGTWERKPGTLCSARSGYSQEADTRQDWPSLATQSAHSFLQRFWS